MDNKEKELYIANVIMVMKADNEYTSNEMEALQIICQPIGADESHIKNAITTVENDAHKLCPVKRFSDQIRNLEDMIFVSLSSGTFPESEKNIVLSYAKTIQLTQPQINIILRETKNRFKAESMPFFCTKCGKHMTEHSSFCPFCGHPQ